MHRDQSIISVPFSGFSFSFPFGVAFRNTFGFAFRNTFGFGFCASFQARANVES